MRKALAIALLDFRRLGFGLVAASLIGGLIPSLATGLGGAIPAATILVVMFLIVGSATGGYFGNDFADGRASFYFARPLPTWSLMVGRMGGLLALSGAAFAAFMGSYWISSRGRPGFDPWIITLRHVEALGISWSLSLFAALSIAAHGRFERSGRRLRDLVMIPVRLFLSLLALTVTFGLFADLMMRAYRDPTPIQLLFGSSVVAAFIASCVAIAAGRTERLRITRFQNLVMICHFVLLFVVVGGAWAYVLHPGPAAIRAVGYQTWGSLDGRSAFVHARVNRGDPWTFSPIFILDIASGQARLLNADPYMAWASADGATMVWSEATPLFFRPLWRFLGGATTFRVRTSTGEVEVLPMPSKLPDGFKANDLTDPFGRVDRVLPSPDGDVFAILWDRHLGFTSRSRGELSEADLGSPPAIVREWVFLPSGSLRVALLLGKSSPDLLEFVDIDPKTGKLSNRVPVPVESVARIQIDKNATRALVTSRVRPGRGSTIMLIDLKSETSAARPVILADGLFPGATFLEGGRIAATAGGMGTAWGTRIVRVFSPVGQLVLDVPVGEGTPPRLGGEMFPGVIAVNIAKFSEDVSLIDTTSGATLRHIPGLYTLPNFEGTPPPGSPSARLMQSADGKLFELPSLTAEPRLLLPLAKR